MTDTKSSIVSSYKSIPGFDAYRITSDGRIQSCLLRGNHPRKTDVWRMINPVLRKNGYLYVTLCQDGRRCPQGIHVLVLKTFVGECPEGMECRHLDDNPSNNRLSNLCWGTKKENAGDRIRNGHNACGERNGFSSLKKKQVIEIRRLHSLGIGQQEIADRFNVTQPHVSRIVLRQSWAHVE